MIHVPQINAQIVGGDECFAIAVERDTVDVVGMGVGVDLLGQMCNDRLSPVYLGYLQLFQGLPLTNVSIEIAVDDLGCLSLVHFPQLDRLV